MLEVEAQIGQGNYQRREIALPLGGSHRGWALANLHETGEELPTLHMPGRPASHHKEVGDKSFLSPLESFLGGGRQKSSEWGSRSVVVRLTKEPTWDPGGAFLGTSISGPCCIPKCSHVGLGSPSPHYIHTCHTLVQAGVRGGERSEG